MGCKPGRFERWNYSTSITFIEKNASTFAPIWIGNSILSPQFFSALSLNHTITTLMLTNTTLFQEFIPPLCQLLLTNQTIKALDISGNLLAPSTELNQAFKQNKSIQVLNISGNKFNQDVLDSLLESDSIQYLVIDKTFAAQHQHQHQYFSQSKSLIKCFI
ncbi:hypothetical protein DFA_06491 [Cavenderia fasciculata]|uniref:Leucine-rich repeat-containing protein n=1 Tax=Cavenderia fasciculata TaxID=261658 RepID=F4PJ55_CACFS|nr:uncharacterized protein DFA_06491 [Cavenderia fasciculata]EGG24341.1 hypothetical protein DFA_06491 [Cavenderia fasciculata]|eukprot:XP_004362192.1 hypothetical protein DFA_06491 [Cavenderia fasciculata]